MKQSPFIIGWKSIAAYLNCDVDTAKELTRKSGLPVFKPLGQIMTTTNLLDKWAAENAQNQTGITQ